MFPISMLVVGFLLSIDCYTLLCYIRHCWKPYIIYLLRVYSAFVCVYISIYIEHLLSILFRLYRSGNVQHAQRTNRMIYYRVIAIDVERCIRIVIPLSSKIYIHLCNQKNRFIRSRNTSNRKLNKIMHDV